MSEPSDPKQAPPTGGEGKPKRPQRDANLKDDGAKAGGPSDMSVIGEEDPGAGLEFLVKRERPKPDRQDD